MVFVRGREQKEREEDIKKTKGSSVDEAGDRGAQNHYKCAAASVPESLLCYCFREAAWIARRRCRSVAVYAWQRFAVQRPGGAAHWPPAYLHRKTRAQKNEVEQPENAAEAALARIVELEKELDSKEVPFQLMLFSSVSCQLPPAN